MLEQFIQNIFVSGWRKRWLSWRTSVLLPTRKSFCRPTDMLSDVCASISLKFSTTIVISKLGIITSLCQLVRLLSVGCLTSQRHASVSQGRICSDNCTCCHTEIEVADQTFHLTQSQHTDTGPTSPSTDPITPGA